MLPGEIEPFADRHIEKLTELIDVVHQAHIAKTDLTLTSDEVKEMCVKLDGAREALVRFKICMADEVKQKTRYAKFAHENGYKYS